MSTGSARVGILTLHYGFNEGAVLQAYALAGLIGRHLAPADVEIVDQRYPSKLAVNVPPKTQRTSALQHAIDDWLPIGALRLRTNDSAAAKAAISGRYDLLVFGSDQVWSLSYQRRFRAILSRGLFPVQKSPFLPAYPNVYWPDERLPIPQACFAAAVGALRWKDIPRRHAAAMRRGFSACPLISVRDERSLRFLEWLGSDLAARTAIVPDPTFSHLLRTELSEAQALQRIRSQLEQMGVDFSRPRCGIVSRDRESLRSLAVELRRQGVQTIGITTKNDFCDVNLFDHGFHPLDWARVFRFLDFCVSERMHACIFCLLQRTPFVAIDINTLPGDPDTKVRGLMRTFQLERFCIPKDALDDKVLNQACRWLNEHPWDWMSIEKTIQHLGEVQVDFLRKMSALVAAA